MFRAFELFLLVIPCLDSGCDSGFPSLLYQKPAKNKQKSAQRNKANILKRYSGTVRNLINLNCFGNCLIFRKQTNSMVFQNIQKNENPDPLHKNRIKKTILTEWRFRTGASPLDCLWCMQEHRNTRKQSCF